MKKSHLTIATRESPLALWQANWVKEHLEMIHPGLSIQLLGMTTSADRMLSIPLTEVGGKGLFVKELEEALLDGRADIAVHSMKDVPMDLPEGLCLPVMCVREDVRDALVSNLYSELALLPPQAKVGTSSLRRQSQLHALRPDLNLLNLRGNVHTRLSRLDSGEYSAIILAAAGLKRLGLQQRIKYFFNIEEILPAAGQGVLGIECRSDDAHTQDLISLLNHAETNDCVTAERAMCKRLGGSCQVPIGAYAEMVEKKIKLRGLVASVDGAVIVRAEKLGAPSRAETLGEKVADELLRQGAKEILNLI